MMFRKPLTCSTLHTSMVIHSLEVYSLSLPFLLPHSAPSSLYHLPCQDFRGAVQVLLSKWRQFHHTLLSYYTLNSQCSQLNFSSLPPFPPLSPHANQRTDSPLHLDVQWPSHPILFAKFFLITYNYQGNFQFLRIFISLSSFSSPPLLPLIILYYQEEQTMWKISSTARNYLPMHIPSFSSLPTR